MADVALRSNQKQLCRTLLVQKCRQIITNRSPTETHHKDDPQIPQPYLRFVKKTAKQKQRGKSPNNKTHKKDLPWDTVVTNMPDYFFSSGLADVALRLGSDCDKSGERKCTWTQLARTITANQNKINQNHHKPRRPANPPAIFAFRQENSKAKATGQEPKQQNPQKGFAMGHSGNKHARLFFFLGIGRCRTKARF